MLKATTIAGILLIGHVSAAVIYTDAPPPGDVRDPSTGSRNTRYLNATEVGAAGFLWDIGPDYFTVGRWDIEQGAVLPSESNGFGGSGFSLVSFAPTTSGDTIDATATFEDFAWAEGEGLPRSLFTLGTSILAFTAGPDLASSSSPEVFGWVEYTIFYSPVDGKNELYFNRWAFEDSGGAIQAGAVPEPSALGLACLAGGLLFLRRRR